MHSGHFAVLAQNNMEAAETLEHRTIMNKGRILIIDDEEIVRTSCHRILEPEGYSVKTADNGKDGFTLLKNHTFDLVITDLMMPDMDGIEVLRKIRETWPDTEVIIMTGYGTVKTAVRAMKIGVFDYIEKPFNPEDLLSLTAKALERKKLMAGNIDLREVIPSHYELSNIVGISQAIQKVFQLIARVANTGSTVLITGESGTGKELVAKAIHFNSSQKGPALHCRRLHDHPGDPLSSQNSSDMQKVPLPALTKRKKDFLSWPTAAPSFLTR